MSETGVLVALGANLGDPVHQLEGAILALEKQLGGPDWRVSSLWRSRPLDCPPGSPDFVNAAVAWALPTPSPWASPRELLAVLRALELDFGRPEARSRNAPRSLDLDLILFGALRSRAADCTLPHPRAHQRRFVLEPAAEVAPDWVWPGTSRSIRALRDALRDDPSQADIGRLST